MQIIETDASGATVSVLHQTQAPTPAETAQAEPSAPPEPDTQEQSAPRIEHLYRRVQVLEAKAHALTETLLGLKGGEMFHLAEAAEAASASVTKLAQTLLAMREVKVEVHSTPKSRAMAKLRPGAPVRFVDAAMAAQFCEAYRLEEMPTMVIDKVSGDHLWLSAGDGMPVGRVRWSEVKLDEKDIA